MKTINIDNETEVKGFLLEYLIDARDKLLEKGLEPVIDELLIDLDPENKWHWNLMDDSEYKAESLEDWQMDRAKEIDRGSYPSVFIN